MQAFQIDRTDTFPLVKIVETKDSITDVMKKPGSGRGHFVQEHDQNTGITYFAFDGLVGNPDYMSYLVPPEARDMALKFNDLVATNYSEHGYLNGTDLPYEVSRYALASEISPDDVVIGALDAEGEIIGGIRVIHHKSYYGAENKLYTASVLDINQVIAKTEAVLESRELEILGGIESTKQFVLGHPRMARHLASTLMHGLDADKIEDYSEKKLGLMLKTLQRVYFGDEALGITGLTSLPRDRFTEHVTSFMMSGSGEPHDGIDFSRLVISSKHSSQAYAEVFEVISKIKEGFQISPTGDLKFSTAFIQSHPTLLMYLSFLGKCFHPEGYELIFLPVGDTRSNNFQFDVDQCPMPGYYNDGQVLVALMREKYPTIVG